MPESQQILPPENNRAIERHSTRSLEKFTSWFSGLSKAKRIGLTGFSAAPIVGYLLWAFNEFTSIRGWTNVLASRFVLASMWVAGTLLVFILTCGLQIRRWAIITTAFSMLFLYGSIGLDRIAPKPTANSQNTPPRQRDVEKGMTPESLTTTDSVRATIQRAAPKPSLDPDFIPSVDVIYQNKQIQVHNRGRTNLYLWGAAYGNADVPIDKEPVMVAPGIYYYFSAEMMENQMLSRLKDGEEGTTPFRAFATNEESKKMTIRANIVGKVSNRTVAIRTQVLPIINGWENVNKLTLAQ
jgi:hypothetical protein